MEKQSLSDDSLLLIKKHYPGFNEKDNNLFVLVRHKGCTFCRETLENLSMHYSEIKAAGLKPVVIHMGPPESGELMQQEFSLPEVDFVSNPDRELYQFFGARRGHMNEVLGPKVVARAVLSGALVKYGIGKLEGDGFQLGGVYLFVGNQATCLHRPEHAGDIEDWSKVLTMAQKTLA